MNVDGNLVLILDTQSHGDQLESIYHRIVILIMEIQHFQKEFSLSNSLQLTENLPVDIYDGSLQT